MTLPDVRESVWLAGTFWETSLGSPDKRISARRALTLCGTEGGE